MSRQSKTVMIENNGLSPRFTTASEEKTTKSSMHVIRKCTPEQFKNYTIYNKQTRKTLLAYVLPQSKQQIHLRSKSFCEP